MQKLFRLFRYDWPLHFVLLLSNWLPDNVIFIRLRERLARPFFKKCGKRLGLGRNITFYNPSNIEIGNDVYIAYGCWLLGSGRIDIDNEVILSPYCVLSTGNHTRQHKSFRYGPPKIGSIKIGYGAWIGAQVVVMCNVAIGAGSVVAANTTVLQNVPPNVLYGPTKQAGIIRELGED